MKTRQGIDEAMAFGPAKSPGTVWILEHKNGQVERAIAATAFMAAASIGWTLGELKDVRPS